MMGLNLFSGRVKRRSGDQNASLRDTYEASLVSLLSCREMLSVVIVGANDGCINDPFFDLANRFPDRTDVILIEPQKSLLPFLSKNYAFHPCHQIINGAIGSMDTLTLYTVKEEYWPVIVPSYANGWPPYRAPTGITSSERQHVVDWVARWSDIAPEVAISPIVVACWPLDKLLSDNSRLPTIDVLQIDAEGMDDVVLYACCIEQTQPRLIYLESKSLSAARLEKMNRFLQTAGYELRASGGDTLAVLSIFRP